MPVKRRYSELTGGSGDVNPQTLVLKVVQSGADVQTSIGTPLPIPRMPIANGKSIVMEFLSLDFDRLGIPLVNGVTSWLGVVTTNPLGPNGTNYADSADQVLSDPRVLGTWNQSVASGATQVTNVIEHSYKLDLTDEAGHGMLVATDNIYFALVTQNTTQANVCYCKVKYRFKEVSLQEYIGIVQSQQ